MAKQEATLGGGCFWCTEAVFSKLKGVIEVRPGYAGGTWDHPTYQEVCSGKTGHIEVSRIIFDDELLSFEKLLEVFWFTHDPTTENRQGNDIGEQYQSVVFFHHEEQKKIADFFKDKLNSAQIYQDPIITKILPLTTFYFAEENHKSFYLNNPNQGYCQFVIKPKVEKFEALFAEIIK